MGATEGTDVGRDVGQDEMIGLKDVVVKKILLYQHG